MGFGFLSDAEVEYLKARVEDILADYGVAILHPEAYRRFLAAGAKPGTDANRIRMPRELIREAMAATPKAARLGGGPSGSISTCRGATAASSCAPGQGRMAM